MKSNREFRASGYVRLSSKIIWLLSVLTLAACDETIDDIGIEGIDQEALGGRFRKDTLFADQLTNAVSFMDSVPTSLTDRLYLGAVDGNEFRIIFYFNIPADAESVIVLPNTTRLNLTYAGAYGGTGSFTASVYPVQRAWESADLRWNRFQPGVDYGTVPIVQFNVTATDSSKVQQTIPLPRDTVQQWVYARTDTTRHNYGILIDFPANPGFVAQFYGANVTQAASATTPDKAYAPSLVFEYQKVLKSGQIFYDSATVFPIVLSGYGSYNGGRQGYLYRDVNPRPASELNVGSGVIYHTLLRFNTNNIPHGATISRADLVLNIDPAGDYRRQTGDSISLQTVRTATDTSGWTPGNVVVSGDDYSWLTYDNLSQRWLTDNAADDTLRFTITRQFQKWVNNPSSNCGLQIYNARELKGGYDRLYRLRIYNNYTLDKYRSPRIIIYYTLPPED